ncbi:MAG: helix-turn-helix domain-containing protein [Proteobacteria bacterium]|jgi:excisionase family DNA binding protein|nr:helix-turn-helix domain-containing protein [Pseudomonadota bacterium]MBK7116598.1 helix-turn-helix domain-containing protein [Pseudomonadota bacterium]MBK9251468.1 helix-turn-helix domain-containing protein [Pseudomonadota bacterium]
MAPDVLGLMSVEQVASSLGVHVRTVRRYIHEGRLRATRIGRLYRIPATELTALAGGSVRKADPQRLTRHCEASTVVQIDAIAPDAAMRVMTGIGGAIKGRDKLSDTPLRVDTVYDETRARLKIIVTGSLSTTVGLLNLLESYA